MSRPFRFKVISHGCRVNQYEGDALAAELEAAGGIPSAPEEADCLVLVSCAVTAEAERKTRQELRRLKRRSSGALLVVCGCWVNRVSDQDLESMGVDVAVSNGLKGTIPGLVERHLHGFPVGGVYRSSAAGWDPLSLRRTTRHTRAFVKVQDGCSRGCTYCIVPKLRGPSISRPFQEVLSEVRSLVESGALEVVLTGVHLGDYRWDGLDLADLVRALSSVEGLGRIRFGSIEPFGLSQRLLEALGGSRSFMPHLHVPLQSGDDQVLRRMGRGYGGSDYVEMVRRARQVLGDDLHVSADVMVGFPGEDQVAFDNTLRVLEEARVGRLHVFPYSPRPGTAAYHWPRPQDDTVRERVQRLLEFGRRSLGDFARGFVGREVRVLVERVEDRIGDGLAEPFLRVRFPYEGPPGRVVSVVPTGEVEGLLVVGDRAFESPGDLLYPL